VAAAHVNVGRARDASIHVMSSVGSAPGRASPKEPNSIVWLGPADRIVLQPRPIAAGSRAGSVAPDFDVDELYWLRIRPGSVMIDARFQVQVHSGRLERLRIVSDPRWTLLGPPGSSISQAQTDPDDAPLVDLETSRPVIGASTIEASFRLDGATGIGCWQLPAVEIKDAKSRRQFWAATVDPSLLSESHLAANTSKISADDFARRWGIAELK